MKKVLEGELTSLAHSILKAKSDDVHMLKEKAGLLYEKLCILSFAEKHFTGKQPSIGKVEFKSAFEYDLDAEVVPKSPSHLPEISEKTPSNTKINPISVAHETPSDSVSNKDEAKPIDVEPTQEKSTSKTKHDKNEEVVDVSKKPQAVKNTLSDDNKLKNIGSNKEDNSSENKNDNPLFQALAEEDFGVHMDDLPDFEPIPDNPKIPEEASDITQNSENAAEISTSNEEKKVEVNQEAAKPQRTIDLFSQDKKSLNDQLKTDLKIGLNDRLAFSKKLFDGDVDAYNKTLAKISHFNTYAEVEMYLYNEVRPHFSWDKHEAIEQRFLELISTKFN